MLSKIMTVRIEEGIYERLKEIANNSNIPISLLARKMIETGVKENWKVDLQKDTLGETRN